MGAEKCPIFLPPLLVPTARQHRRRNSATSRLCSWRWRLAMVPGADCSILLLASVNKKTLPLLPPRHRLLSRVIVVSLSRQLPVNSGLAPTSISDCLGKQGLSGVNFDLSLEPTSIAQSLWCANRSPPPPFLNLTLQTPRFSSNLSCLDQQESPTSSTLPLTLPYL